MRKNSTKIAALLVAVAFAMFIMPNVSANTNVDPDGTYEWGFNEGQFIGYKVTDYSVGYKRTIILGYTVTDIDYIIDYAMPNDGTFDANLVTMNFTAYSPDASASVLYENLLLWYVLNETINMFAWNYNVSESDMIGIILNFPIMPIVMPLFGGTDILALQEWGNIAASSANPIAQFGLSNVQNGSDWVSFDDGANQLVNATYNANGIMTYGSLLLTPDFGEGGPSFVLNRTFELIQSSELNVLDQTTFTVPSNPQYYELISNDEFMNYMRVIFDSVTTTEPITYGSLFPTAFKTVNMSIDNYNVDTSSWSPEFETIEGGVADNYQNIYMLVLYAFRGSIPFTGMILPNMIYKEGTTGKDLAEMYSVLSLFGERDSMINESLTVLEEIDANTIVINYSVNYGDWTNKYINFTTGSLFDTTALINSASIYSNPSSENDGNITIALDSDISSADVGDLVDVMDIPPVGEKAITIGKKEYGTNYANLSAIEGDEFIYLSIENSVLNQFIYKKRSSGTEGNYQYQTIMVKKTDTFNSTEGIAWGVKVGQELIYEQLLGFNSTYGKYTITGISTLIDEDMYGGRDAFSVVSATYSVANSTTGPWVSSFDIFERTGTIYIGAQNRRIITFLMGPNIVYLIGTNGNLIDASISDFFSTMGLDQFSYSSNHYNASSSTNTNKFYVELNARGIASYFDISMMGINRTIRLIEEAPVASFKYTKNAARYTFISNSTFTTYPIASYLWNFGDGSISTQNIVTHDYATNGNYTVTLTIVNTYGESDSTTQNVEMFVHFDPVVEILSVQTFPNGTVIVTAKITVTAYEIVNATYDMGDDSTIIVVTSMEEAELFTYTYSQNGTYTISITVNDGHGKTASDTYQITIAITEPIPKPIDYTIWYVIGSIGGGTIAIGGGYLLYRQFGKKKIDPIGKEPTIVSTGKINNEFDCMVRGGQWDSNLKFCRL